MIFYWCLYKKRTLHGRLGIQNISLSVEKYFLTWEETFHISLPPYTILYIYVRCDTTFSGKFKDKLCLRVSILKLVLSLQKWQNRWTSYSKPWWGRNYISKTTKILSKVANIKIQHFLKFSFKTLITKKQYRLAKGFHLKRQIILALKS